jgi:hypothetical protein
LNAMLPQVWQFPGVCLHLIDVRTDAGSSFFPRP